jgi:hypothetical protein
MFLAYGREQNISYEPFHIKRLQVKCEILGKNNLLQ